MQSSGHFARSMRDYERALDPTLAQRLERAMADAGASDRREGISPQLDIY